MTHDSTQPTALDSYEYWPPDVMEELVRRRKVHGRPCILQRRQGPITAKGHGGGLLRLVDAVTGKVTAEADGTPHPDLDDSLICPPFCLP